MKLYKPKRPSVNPQCSMFFVGDQGFVKYGDERYLELKQMEKDGLINDLQLQVPFVLIPPFEIEIDGKKRKKKKDGVYC